MMDKTLVLIDRVQDLQEKVDSQERYIPSGDSFPGQITTVTTLPAVATAVYAIHPIRITGSIGEGMVPTLTALTTVVWAANLGIGIPTGGEYVDVSRNKGRYSFIFNG